jgi:carbamoyl-phosphate synthase large subunit
VGKRVVPLSVVGQTANNLALPLMVTGKVRVLGTTVDAIDTAEGRFRFNEFCDILGIDQPKWQAFRTHSLRSC